MAWSYTNCLGKTYYLYARETRAGNTRYDCKLEQTDEALDALPDGYEVNENPNGQVTVRKIKAQVISDEELAVVEKVIKAHKLDDVTKLERKGKSLIVHYGEAPTIPRFMPTFSDIHRERVENSLKLRAFYEPMLKFELVDKESRFYCGYRWCYMGSIDDWYELEAGSLKTLAESLIPHLGQDSFFELL